MNALSRVTRHEPRWQVAIALLAILQFCLFLNHRDITTAHEGRVAVTSREMLQRRDWLVPHLNGQPRLQKPPLAYWLTAAAWSLGGSREVWLARIPAAMCGALASLLIMDLARRLLGRDAALIAGIVWISTWFVVDEYRKAMSDPYLAFFTLLTIWSWVAAHGSATPRQSAAPPRILPRALIVFAHLSLGIGTLTKGPVILLHVGIALISFHLIRRSGLRGRAPAASGGLIGGHIIGVFAFLLLCTAWPMFILRTVPGAWDLWRHELTASSATSGAKSGPFWHYLINLPLTAAPWTIFGLIGILMPLLARRRRERRALWPLVWLGATVLVFSLVPMKKNSYLLPAMPAQTLLITAAIASCVRLPRRSKDAANERLLLIVHAAGATISVGVMIYLVMGLEQFEIEPPAPLMAAGAVTLFLLLGWRQVFPRLRSLRTVALIGVGFTLCVHAAEAWIIPDRDNRRSDAPLAHAARVAAEGQSLVVIGPGLREDVLFYIGQSLPVLASIDDLPDDFKGCALVAPQERDAVRRADRGDELTSSANRPDKDKVYLFAFPKAPPPPPGERR